jgi:NAD(P)H-dependent FMN reductase
MRLTVFNGSPRGKKSNTLLLLEQLRRGFESTPGNELEIVHLFRAAPAEERARAFAAAERVLVAFPLYSDAMPSIVKELFEALDPLCGRPDNPPLGFIVQSGFPETLHSRPVARYLQKLCRRLGCPYLGTVLKGGVEGIQVMPPAMTRPLFRRFFELGEHLGRTGELDPRPIARLARMERYTFWGRVVFRLVSAVGLTSWYWGRQLKKNGAYERRLARPYATADEKRAGA